MKGSITFLSSLEPPPSWLRGNLPVSLLPSPLLISAGSVTLPVPGSVFLVSEFLSRWWFSPRTVSLAPCLSVSTPPTPSSVWTAVSRVSAWSRSSLHPAGSRSLSRPRAAVAARAGAGRSGGCGPGGVRARGGGLGAFLRQSLPSGGAGAAAARRL